MPRNQSEQDPARDPLLAWAEAAEKARLNQPVRSGEDNRQLVIRRNALREAVPQSAIDEHWADRCLIRLIVKSIYDKYGWPDGTQQK